MHVTGTLLNYFLVLGMKKLRQRQLKSYQSHILSNKPSLTLYSYSVYLNKIMWLSSWQSDLLLLHTQEDVCKEKRIEN